MEMTLIPKQELLELKQKAELDQELLIKLVRGLEDIRAGRLKSWDSVKTLD